MKKSFFFLLLLFIVNASAAFSQLSGWTQRLPIQVIDTTGIARSGYTLLLRIDTQTPVNLGHMEASGDDIRFGDPCAFMTYPHWIDNYMNTDSTLIWVRVDTIPANDTLEIAMFYGNPGAADGNDFGLTFPSRLVTGGADATLTGDQTFDWVQVNAGDTLFIGSGDTLEIRARKVIVMGTIWGKGRGYVNGGPNTVGGGPGGGGYSLAMNAGAGGGGYGGNGGTSGFDPGDSPGAGGISYGTATGTDIDMGSAGGSSSNTPGGSGGGGLFIDAEIILCNGKIDLSGIDGTPPGGSQGGGGGAGGGMLMIGRRVNLSGANISSLGGNGSVGTSTFNDSGGGGGGGRLKVRSTSFAAAATFTANGGTGGPYGGQAPGQAGVSGTTSTQSGIPYPAMHINVLPQEPYIEVSLLTLLHSDADLILCPGDQLVTDVNSGYDQYDFYQDGLIQASSASESFTYTSITSAAWVEVVAISGSCTSAAGDSVFLHPLSSLSITSSGAGACNGVTDTLTATAGFVFYLWSGGSNTNSMTTSVPGTYGVTVTDGNNCTQVESITVNDLGFTAAISTNDSTPCTGESVMLTASGGSSPTFMWSNSSTTPSISVSTSNTYSVTVTSSNGCMENASVTLTFNTPPVVNITNLGATLDAGPGFSTYQWFLNGNLLPGETNQTTPGPSGAGIATYVVVVTDANGCTGSDTLSINLSVGDGWQGIPMSLAPNPTAGPLMILFELERPAEVLLELQDLTGRILHRSAGYFSTGKQQLSLDLGEWPAAVYLLSLSADDRISTMRVVKD